MNVRYRCRCGRTFADKLGIIEISLPDTYPDEHGRPVGMCPVALPLPNEEWPNWQYDPDDPDLTAIDWHIFKAPRPLRALTRLYWWAKAKKERPSHFPN